MLSDREAVVYCALTLKNLTPADVFYGRGQEILDQREKIKLATLAMRRKLHYDNHAEHALR